MRCFFDFFIPLPSKTPTFESISGKLLSRNALKSRCFRWEGYEKVKKTSSDSSGGTGRLWRSGSALGGSGGAQGGPGRALGGSGFFLAEIKVWDLLPLDFVTVLKFKYLNWKNNVKTHKSVSSLAP